MSLVRQKAWHFEAEYGGLDYRDAVVLDIGADYGCTAEFFLARGAASVVAVERNPEWRARLIEWAEDKPVDVLPGELDACTADPILQYAQADIVKCDCEGCEAHLLGVPDAILGAPRAWVMETHTLALYHDFMTRFEALGYRVRVVREWGNLPNKHGKLCKVIQAERKSLETPR